MYKYCSQAVGNHAGYTRKTNPTYTLSPAFPYLLSKNYTQPPTFYTLLPGYLYTTFYTSVTGLFKALGTAYTHRAQPLLSLLLIKYINNYNKERTL